MLINEIITHGKGPFIVYFRGDSWQFEDESEEFDFENNESHRKFKEKLEPYIQQMVDEKFEFEEGRNLDDILGELEESSEIIAGTIDGNSFELSPIIGLNFRHSTANKNLLKIMEEYNVDRVVAYYTQFDETGEEMEQVIEHGKEEFLEPLENKTFYHGTEFSSLQEILNKGLMADVNKTNFDNIHHEDAVFITINYEKATFHAIHAAQKNPDTLPIIIEFEIPDVSKLVLDYDIAIELYGKEHPLTMSLNYDEINEMATGNIGAEIYNGIRHGMNSNYIDQITDKSSLNTKLGVFGYKGRIAASKIKNIHIDREGIDAWVKADEVGMDLKEIGYDMMNFVKDAERLKPKEVQLAIDNAREDLESEMEDEDDD
ncbi:hypothetical protein PBI_SCTP2_401 [Salicola phage SCTP-2]|nr:hypothetical protein PBI_SCTP2_401 [Salicola phage SCTP-2]